MLCFVGYMSLADVPLFMKHFVNVLQSSFLGKLIFIEDIFRLSLDMVMKWLDPSNKDYFINSFQICYLVIAVAFVLPLQPIEGCSTSVIYLVFIWSLSLLREKCILGRKYAVLTYLLDCIRRTEVIIFAHRNNSFQMRIYSHRKTRIRRANIITETFHFSPHR